MANFKRKKSKRIVRCTLCTRYRHLGNAKARTSVKTKKLKDKAREQMEDV